MRSRPRTGSASSIVTSSPRTFCLPSAASRSWADFGIAHISGGFETATGAVTGSPAYTAPEVLDGSPHNPAANIYGLGATLFTALTGHAAFERRSGEQVVAQLLRITTHTMPDLRAHGIPEDVSGTIARAMSRKLDQRAATAADFGEQLRACNADTAFRSTTWRFVRTLVGRGAGSNRRRAVGDAAAVVPTGCDGQSSPGPDQLRRPPPQAHRGEGHAGPRRAW